MGGPIQAAAHSGGHAGTAPGERALPPTESSRPVVCAMPKWAEPITAAPTEPHEHLEGLCP
jgi:hypothetical protein